MFKTCHEEHLSHQPPFIRLTEDDSKSKHKARQEEEGEEEEEEAKNETNAKIMRCFVRMNVDSSSPLGRHFNRSVDRLTPMARRMQKMRQRK